MYLPERDLLPLLLKQSCYEAYFHFVDLQHIRDNYKELYYLYLSVKSLHEKFPGRDHSLEALQTYFFALYPDVAQEAYVDLFKMLQEAPVDPEVGVGILKQIKQRQQAVKLSEEAIKVATGYGDLSKLKELADGIDQIEVVTDEEPYGMDLEEILHSAILKPGLRWRLESLNKSLGSLRDGDFGFLFKRPETGGTAFCASEAGYMLDQAERPIFWFNNEESDNKVKLRIYQSYFGITLEQLLANPKKYAASFKERVGDKFRFYGIDYCNRQTIEELVAKHKPQLVLYDQLDKISGFEAERDDLLLGAKYQWARELCKQGHAAIGVTQADGTAEGVKWLTMQHVANAKTSKQAEGDWILGMGKTHADGAENVRYLSICKNKLLGDPDSIPDLRHGRFEVWIEPSIMQFKDIMKYD